MRDYEGQRSDGRPIRRSYDEKRKALARLVEDYGRLSSRVGPEVREGMRRRIAELKDELGMRPPPRRPSSPAPASGA
jgi:hypothetical protein